MVQQLIPKFESGLQGQPSAKESEKPLNQVNLRLDSHSWHLLSHRRQAVFEHSFKTSTNWGDKGPLHRKEPPEERISKHKVTEKSKRTNFTQNRNENQGRISHALHVANVGPENVEYFEELHNL